MRGVVTDDALTRVDEISLLADDVVAAASAGRPYARELANLCARCEAAGVEHAAVLEEAMWRAKSTPAG
jgi:hypothetical protein